MIKNPGTYTIDQTEAGQFLKSSWAEGVISKAVDEFAAISGEGVGAFTMAEPLWRNVSSSGVLQAPGVAKIIAENPDQFSTLIQNEMPAISMM